VNAVALFSESTPQPPQTSPPGSSRRAPEAIPPTRSQKIVQTGPLLSVIGSISAAFIVAILVDKLKAPLRSQPVLDMAKAHVTALVLTPFVLLVSLAVVLVFRVVVGHLWISVWGVVLRDGAAGVLLWAICVVVIVWSLYMFGPVPLLSR
jgi:TRAP-type mannitol/chloroaromatic compound transport system permease large subunit